MQFIILIHYRERLDNKNVHLIQIDVTNDKSVEKAVSKIESEQGRLDVLVNNAGNRIYFHVLIQSRS